MSDRPTTIRQTLAELELLSHGSTQAWNKSAPPAERDNRPAGESNPPHVEYRRQYDAATTDLERERIHKAAKDELKEWRTPLAARTKTKSEPEHLRREEIINKGAGWDASEVARVYKTTVREIVEIRTAANRCPSTGKIPPAEEDASDQARRLFDQGMTVRQIAEYQNVAKSIVGRRVKRAA